VGRDERRAAVAEPADATVGGGRVGAGGWGPAVCDQLRDAVAPQPDEAIDLGEAPSRLIDAAEERVQHRVDAHVRGQGGARPGDPKHDVADPARRGAAVRRSGCIPVSPPRHA
jgi:hypothetical protein